MILAESANEVKYPIEIQTFEKLRTEGYLYVDKTAYIHKLLKRGQYYFLSRPRRFGKSLLLSTIKAYFEGKKELFSGLAIEAFETEWKRYPVISLSLEGYSASQKNIKELLGNGLREYEDKYATLGITEDLPSRFRNVIRAACEKTGEKVVILIDEYDSPIVAHLEEDDYYREIRDMMRSFYTGLKDMDEYIRFGMLTGVSRFSKMSIFSGLNNLDDISLYPEYNAICGITEEEIEANFSEGIEKLASELSMTTTEARHLLKKNYDGYHFTRKEEDIYNPFSLIKALAYSEIGDYWFSTGTPGFLVREIRKSEAFLPELFTEEVQSSTLSSIEAYRKSPVSLLFQTGYLTISHYNAEDDVYTLRVPNKEVENGLYKALLSGYMRRSEEANFKQLLGIRKAFRKGNADEALKLTKIFLAAIPYELSGNKPEIYFENNLYLLYKLVGINTKVEWRTSVGRIDMVLEMPEYIYIIEFKLHSSAAEAINQIEKKEYALAFANSGKEIVKIGVKFSSETRNIENWIIMM